MGLSSCSIKFLKTAYIGYGVRLTGGKNTSKFDNVPMKDVKITKYDEKGFMISHPNMPEDAHLDFLQLPLIDLTIVNGVIKNEITFVENIVARCTEFIKTDSDEYKSAISESNLDSKLSLVGPLKLTPGDKVISAQCKEGIEMIFIGNFYQAWINKEYPKKTTRPLNSWTSNIDYDADPEVSISNDAPLRRAMFIRKVDIDDMSMESSMTPSNVKDFFSKDFKLELKNYTNHGCPYGERLKQRQKIYANINKLIRSAYKDIGYKHLYEIVEYPITNKYVKELMVIGQDIDYKSINKNGQIINSHVNLVPITDVLKLVQYTSSYYGFKDFVVHPIRKDVKDFAEEYIKDLYEVVKSSRRTT